MKNNTNNKKENRGGFWYAILAVLTLIVAIIGATYAYLLVSGNNKNNDVIVKAGTLSVKYADGKVVNNPALIPRFKPKHINDTEDAYKKEFIVKSTGSLDQYITIFFDVSNNEFSDNTLKYVVYEEYEEYEENKEVKSGYINGSGNIEIITNSFLKSGNSLRYTMIIWIEENNQLQDSEKNKNISGSFIIDAIQYND